MDELNQHVAGLQSADVDEVSRRLREASTAARPLFALLGRSGTLEVLYEVATNEPIRFSAIKDAIEISSSTLSTRLSELEDAGLVERTHYDENPPRTEYRATERMLDLKPAFYDVIAWAERHGYEPIAVESDADTA